MHPAGADVHRHQSPTAGALLDALRRLGGWESVGASPLAQMTAQRGTSLYDLVDSAYDAPPIHAFSRRLGHVPVIDPNPRHGAKIPLAPAQAQRFRERSAAERVNGLLKERYGGR